MFGGTKMKILLDAMGGDNAPDATIKGAVRAAKELDNDTIKITLGDTIEESNYVGYSLTL